MTVGAFAVAGGALFGIVSVGRADDRVPVLVTTRQLEPGQVISQGDLRVTELSAGTGVQTMSPAQASDVVGQVARGPVAAGTVINAGLFTSGSPLADTEVVVGAALDPGAAPSASLRVGDRVNLVVTPRASSSTPGAPASLGTGTVWAVEELSTAGRKMWVSVRVDASIGNAVAQASADGTLRLLLVGGVG